MIEHQIPNLKVAAPSPLPARGLAFGIRKDWPELASILEKALVTVTPAERLAIEGKYLSLRHDHGVRPGDLIRWGLGIAAAALLVVLGFLIWNRQLRREVERRTAEVLAREESIKESTRRLRLTTSATQIGIYDWDIGTDTIHYSPE